MCLSDTFWHNFAVPPYDEDDEAERSWLSAQLQVGANAVWKKDGNGWYGFLIVFLTYLTKVPFSKEAGTWHSNGQQLSWKMFILYLQVYSHSLYL